MQIRINDFSGTFPRLHTTKLPESAAQACKNVVFDHGILTPAKEAKLSYQSNGFPYEDFMSAMFFKTGNTIYKKFNNNLATYAFSPVHESYRLYWTTEDIYANLMFCDWNMSITGQLTTDGWDYIAGMPPIDPATITVTNVSSTKPVTKVLTPENKATNNTAAQKKLDKELSDKITAELKVESNLEARVYALTYVNAFGDESVPSVKENVYYVAPNQSPVLTVAYPANARNKLKTDYGVEKIRLYRSVTNSLGSTQFLFVKEVGFDLSGSGIAITDGLPKGSLLIGEPLPTINYDPPRKGMKGLGVTDSGVGYAYIDKTVCLTEPYLLYAWPRYYELSSQHDIMGVGNYDNIIVVATTGNPMLISGVAPEDMSVISLPLYEGCISSRSMVNLNHGCMYASENGLVLVTTNSAKLLTEGMFATDDWQKINPKSIHACAYKSGYLFFWDAGSSKGSGYIDLDNPSKGVMWFDNHAINTFKSEGTVQMVVKKLNPVPGVIQSAYQAFNPEYGQTFDNKQFTWRSKTFNLNSPARMLAAQVIADSYPLNAISFRVYANNVLLFETKVKNMKPFRVKNHSIKDDFSIEVVSTIPIREVALGETMREINNQG